MSSRQQILNLIDTHFKESFKDKPFIPGQSKIPVSGRVFDEDDIKLLVDASLDFWLTTGRYAEEFEKVFPLDILPMQILKACKYEDLDEMEALGMYEVAPEDFALTEFICVSKQPHQDIIRKGLDLMYKEIG